MISRNPRIVSQIAGDVHRGLMRSPKSLPAWLFYDEAGSELFEEITRLPEYYLTRTERGIFAEHADEMVAAAATIPLVSPNGLTEGATRGTEHLTLIELGAGTAKKTRAIIRAILNRQNELTFYPLDVSPTALREAVESLTSEYLGLSVEPVVTDYTDGLGDIENVSGRKLVLYIGSSIGNFEPLEASAVLARIRRSLSPGDTLLLGTDMAKDPAVLVRAYDDGQGVTANFNLNVLARINRELGGHFELSAFKHVAIWNPKFSRIEMHLESLREQVVAIDDLGLRVRFYAGERIHTENSYKFTMQMICSILHNGGFMLEQTWMDERQWFGLHLAKVQS